ncbi:MAG: DegV family protein [Anaerolineae bacterium]|nr:DegV family protein [Anaerolineae bacterium]
MSTPPQSPLIVTDAACDIPSQVVEEYAIRFTPLKILFGDEVYMSGVDMTPDQFYERLARGDVHPTTSQPTTTDFMEIYREMGQSGRPILSIHLSEGLSGTVNVARQAAQSLPDLDITVYDTHTLTTALGLQVMVAARAARAGYTSEQILPLLKDTFYAGNMLFTVDDLSYLYRGGRIGSVRYQIGQILHIKPVITVAQEGEKLGTYITAGRARSLPKTIEVFVKIIEDRVGAGNKLRAISMYGDDSALTEALNAQLADRFDCVYLNMVPTAAVLGVHVGPKAMGVSFAAGDWPV